jgi:hypothetical protein
MRGSFATTVTWDKAALGSTRGVAAKTGAWSDCGQWGSGDNGRCDASMGVVVWLGARAALSCGGLSPLRVGARIKY